MAQTLPIAFFASRRGNQSEKGQRKASTGDAGGGRNYELVEMQPKWINDLPFPSFKNGSKPRVAAHVPDFDKHLEGARQQRARAATEARTNVPREIIVTATKEKIEAAKSGNFSSREEFVTYAAPFAIRSERETGVPAAIILAQAIIESRNGNDHMGSARNYFGIKAHGQSGSINFGRIATGYVEIPTREYRGGRFVVENDRFRTYNSMEDSFRDHGVFLTENPRYAGIVEAYATNGDTAEFARGLQHAGYATDPNYAKMVTSIIEKHDLNKYNVRQPNQH